MTSYQIVVATDLSVDSLALLTHADDVTLYTVAPKQRNVRDALKTAHALIARDEVLLDAEVLDTAPLLKVIGRVSAGLNGIDIEAATARGIMVT
ncbi:MAG: phosphoglycerate dehydrogenase, partial [Armatimonadetes bacterium]|nr:phosphoglycerate dehydrogenase [Anaerolineae bacterium]